MQDGCSSCVSQWLGTTRSDLIIWSRAKWRARAHLQSGERPSGLTAAAITAHQRVHLSPLHHCNTPQPPLGAWRSTGELGACAVLLSSDPKEWDYVKRYRLQTRVPSTSDLIIMLPCCPPRFHPKHAYPIRTHFQATWASCVAAVLNDCFRFSMSSPCMQH